MFSVFSALVLYVGFLQEAIVIPPWVALAIRPRPGVWEYVRVNVSELGVEELTVPEYLQFKELLVNGRHVHFFDINSPAYISVL